MIELKQLMMNRIIFLLCFYVIYSSCNGSVRKSSSNIDSLKKEEQLREAISDNDIKKVNELLENGLDINFVNSEDETALLLACKLPHVSDKIIRNLISRGSNVFYESKITDQIPFFLLFENQNQKNIKSFLNSLTKEDELKAIEELYFLPSYISSDDIDIFLKILPLCVNKLISYNKGDTLLQIAIDRWATCEEAYKSQMQFDGKSNLQPDKLKNIVQSILNSGITLSNKTSQLSVFPYASKSPKVVKFVLENGFDIENKLVVHNKFVTPLDFYIRTILNRMEHQIFIEEEKVERMKSTISDEDIEVIEELIRRGDQISGCSMDLYDCIICKFAKKNHINEIKSLLENGWNKDAICLDNMNF